MSNTACFFWGILQHREILEHHLGRGVTYEAGEIANFACYWSELTNMPFLMPEPGARTAGKLVRDLSGEELARMDFAQGCMACSRQSVTVDLGAGGQIEAAIYLPDPAPQPPSMTPWGYDDWAQRFGAEYTEVAKAQWGRFLQKPAIAARLPQLLVRAASSLRARLPIPTKLRLQASPKDVQITARREPYARFFSVEEIDVSYRRFDGSMSPQVTRAGFVSCDAVTVLPYDPVRDRVLVVEQFRAGPLLRGDPQPWQIEAIAGRIDSGETPEQAARREAMEEAGLVLGDLIPAAQYYPSPGILTEFLYSYVALVDLPDGSAGVFGLEGEAEDIRGHLLGFDQLMQLVATGEIGNGPMLLTAYWLAARRGTLRGA